VRPVVHACFVFRKDVLDALNAKMVGGSIDVIDDLGFEVAGCRRGYYSNGEDALIEWVKLQA
jgi:ribosomal protein S18 acetylase RimI-like enzyme